MGLGISKRVGERFLGENAKAGGTCGSHLRVASTRRGAQEHDISFNAGSHLVQRKSFHGTGCFRHSLSKPDRIGLYHPHQTAVRALL